MQLLQRSLNIYKNSKLLRYFSTIIKKELNVKKFGILNVKHNGSLNIYPIDPISYPDQTSAHVCFKKVQNLDKIASYDASTSSLSVNTLHCKDISAVDVKIPVKFDVKVTSVEGVLCIKDLENALVQAILSNVDCKLCNLKTNLIDIQAQNGSIESTKSLHINGSMQITSKGYADLVKVMGSNFTLEVEEGNIRVGSLYVEDCQLSTQHGNITLGQVHQSLKADIHHTGNLSIDCLEGDLVARVKKGDVRLFVSDAKNIEIHVDEGNIHLALPEGHSLCSQHLHLSTHPDHRQKLLNDSVYKDIMAKDATTTNRRVALTAVKGAISLSYMSWADAFLRKKKSSH